MVRNLSLLYMLSELFGRSSGTDRYAYFSDGGHFDNLGLYEMLRRRCQRILVVDAGQDQAYDYFDLGRTVQHSLIDLNVEIKFAPPIVMGKERLGGIVASGTVLYPPQDKEKKKEGQLIYIKPWLPDEIPVEIAAFKRYKKSFPHVSTADQFFTESDFESYRRLGQFICDQMLDVARGAGSDRPIDNLNSLFDAFSKNRQER